MPAIRRISIAMVFTIAAAILAVGAIFAATQKADPSHKQAQVTTDSAGSPVVTPDPIVLKKNTHKAEWVSNNPIKIELADGLEQPCKQIGKEWRCVSKTFAKEGRVKYSVSINAGGAWHTVDPLIDVTP
ncbi:MAG TPA: hypothetical protein VEZ11_13895 [Thermoanaerobaculia bacterium]|nr:hypothetical protein [Thermoanaerobaculia bacterium]